MVELNTDPQNLRKAATGITGVIEGLAGTGFGATYTAGAGRGFGDLDLDGKTIGHADPRAGLSEYCDRWEWGTRALVVGAQQVSMALDLGASVYEREEDYAAKNLRDFGNDLLGDPNLQKESYIDPNTGQIVKGTDDMSFGDLVDHNRNVLTNPDWEFTAEDRAQTGEVLSTAWDSIKQDTGTLSSNVSNPGGAVLNTTRSLIEDGVTPQQPAPAAPTAR